MAEKVAIGVGSVGAKVKNATCRYAHGSHRSSLAGSKGHAGRNEPAEV